MCYTSCNGQHWYNLYPHGHKSLLQEQQTLNHLGTITAVQFPQLMFSYPGYCSVTIVAISYHGYCYHGFCYVTIVTVWIVIQFLSRVCSSCSCSSVTMAILLLFCLMAVQFKLLASLYLSRMNPPTLSSQQVFSSYYGNCSVTIQVAVFQLPRLHICDHSTTQLTLK